MLSLYVSVHVSVRHTSTLIDRPACGILQDMKEARNVIIAMLILLFIIVGVGVAISRIADREKAEGIVKTEDERGFLERIFLPLGDEDDIADSENADTPSNADDVTMTEDGKMVILNESDGDDSESMGTETPKLVFSQNATSGNTKGGVTGDTMGETTTKGGMTQPEEIPSTGSPVAVVAASLAGLAGGLYLRKKA